MPLSRPGLHLASPRRLPALDEGAHLFRARAPLLLQYVRQRSQNICRHLVRRPRDEDVRACRCFFGGVVLVL